MQYCIFSRRGRRVTQSFDYADGRGVAETRSGWNIRAKQSMSLRNLF